MDIMANIILNKTIALDNKVSKYTRKPGALSEKGLRALYEEAENIEKSANKHLTGAPLNTIKEQLQLIRTDIKTITTK